MWFYAAIYRKELDTFSNLEGFIHKPVIIIFSRESKEGEMPRLFNTV